MGGVAMAQGSISGELAGKRRRSRLAVVGVLTLALLTTGVSSAALASAQSPANKSVAKAGGGGVLNFGLEAESTGGFCLPAAQLAASGIQVVNAIYDTLAVINSKGKVVPYLAKSITPNADNTEWTIGLRDGVKFHDGTPVDAAAIELNINTYLGKNPAIAVQLFSFVLKNIDTVTVVDPLTVKIKLKVPQIAFPGYLAGRFGIAAPAQLATQTACSTSMIGSGPFTLAANGWRINESLTVNRNKNYWQAGLPKADGIVFYPISDSQARLNRLTGGEIDLMMTSSSLSIYDLKQKSKQGELKVAVSDRGAEATYLMLNEAKAPFNNKIARQAVALSGNANKVNKIRNRGLNTLATGPFPPDSPAYLSKFPVKHNLKKAKALAKQYQEETGQPLAFEYLALPDPETLATAALTKELSAKAGIEVTIRTVDQATLINEALAGRFQAVGWRNHGGGDPDLQYVWWYSTSPVNFGKFNDPEIDRLLDEGRSEADPAKRIAIYKDLNRRFGSELHNLWAWYTLWATGYQNNVSGVAGVPLPDGGGMPSALSGGVIPTTALLKKK